MAGLDVALPACAKWEPGNGAWTFDLPPAQEAAMPGTEFRGPSAHARLGPQRGHLRDAAERFQAAAGEVTLPRDAWITGVEGALSGLGAAWREHVAFTEAPDGLFDELLDDSVEVAPEVDHLRRDHEVLEAAIARAWQLLASPTAGPDDTKLLQSLTGIGKQVDQHRRRGADLLYQVYSVDVSAGD